MLLERWHGSEICQARADIDRFCAQNEDFDWKENEQANSGILVPMRMVIGFLEVWGRMVESEQADGPLLRRLLGIDAQRAKRNLLDRISNKPDSVIWVESKMNSGMFFTV